MTRYIFIRPKQSMPSIVELRKDGKVSGDSSVLAEIEAAIPIDGLMVTPTGPWVPAEDVMSHAAALYVALERQYGTVKVTGDIPVVPAEEGMIY